MVGVPDNIQLNSLTKPHSLTLLHDRLSTAATAAAAAAKWQQQKWQQQQLAS